MLPKSTAQLSESLLAALDNNQWDELLMTDATLSERRKRLFATVEKIRNGAEGDWEEDFELALELYAGVRDTLAMLHAIRTMDAVHHAARRPSDMTAFLNRHTA